jgi:Toastrack DUF4097
MSSLKPIPSIFLAMIFCAPLFGASQVADSYSKTFQVNGRPSLNIKNVDGRTRITAKEGSTVEIQVTKEVRGTKDPASAKKAADEVEVKLEQTGNRIDVSVKYPRKIFNIGLGPSVMVNFEITSPAASDIAASMVDGQMDVEGFDGKIGITGVDGKTTAANLSGDVTIKGVDGDISATALSGRMDISVVDGDINSDACKGQLNMRSTDGKMHLKDFQGTLETKSGDGNTYLDGVFEAINARTSDGTMEIHARPGSVTKSNWSIHSSDGNLLIFLPNPFPANVELRAGDGKIMTSLPIEVSGRISDRSISGKMNGGGNLLEIEANDGDITISQTPQ